MRKFFFPEFHIRLYDKNSESDYFFFPPPKSEYFFQQHWESEYFFRKKTYPLPFKLNGRSLMYFIYKFQSDFFLVAWPFVSTLTIQLMYLYMFKRWQKVCCLFSENVLIL